MGYQLLVAEGKVAVPINWLATLLSRLRHKDPKLVIKKLMDGFSIRGIWPIWEARPTSIPNGNQYSVPSNVSWISPAYTAIHPPSKVCIWSLGHFIYHIIFIQSAYSSKWKNVSDLVLAHNCCLARMLPEEAALVSEWTGLSGKEKSVALWAVQRTGYYAI